MTTPSQFDPLAEAPRSLRDRIIRKFGRAVEPLALSLLSWCRSLDNRVEAVEKRAEIVEGQIRATLKAVRAMESVVSGLGEAGELSTKMTSLAGKVRDLETRADQAYWSREALVERLNKDDMREEQVVHRLGALEERAEEMYWSRSALVERMNHDDAVVEVINQALSALNQSLSELAARVDEQLPLPLAFGLDYLAMGRRLAAIEDQLEAIVSQPRTATLITFPPQEKAAG
jgi:chromosome segregation ATPase